MPGHQIRFNDTLDDLGWMGEEAFVLRLFHRQKESRSLLPSVHCRHCRRITRCGSQILNPKPVPISFDSSSPHPSTYVSIDDLSIPRIKLAQAVKGRAKYTNPLMEGGRERRAHVDKKRGVGAASKDGQITQPRPFQHPLSPSFALPLRLLSLFLRRLASHLSRISRLARPLLDA